MRAINRKTVITYRYENEKEMDWHIKKMQREGWRVEAPVRNPFFTKGLFRNYSKDVQEGVFL